MIKISYDAYLSGIQSALVWETIFKIEIGHKLKLKKKRDIYTIVDSRDSDCQHFSTLQNKNPEDSFFKPHMVNLWVWEKFLAPISVTLTQGH